MSKTKAIPDPPWTELKAAFATNEDLLRVLQEGYKDVYDIRELMQATWIRVDLGSAATFFGLASDGRTLRFQL